MRNEKSKGLHFIEVVQRKKNTLAKGKLLIQNRYLVDDRINVTSAGNHKSSVYEHKCI